MTAERKLAVIGELCEIQSMGSERLFWQTSIATMSKEGGGKTASKIPERTLQMNEAVCILAGTRFKV